MKNENQQSNSQYIILNDLKNKNKIKTVIMYVNLNICDYLT